MNNFKTKYIFRGLLFAVLTMILGVYIGDAIPWGIGFLEVFYYIILAGSFIALIIYTLWETDTRTDEDYEALLKGKFLPIKFPKTIIAILILAIVAHRLVIGSGAAKSVYNQSVVYNKQYDRATQGLAGFYDNLWKTYLVKEKIANVNKEVFIYVAQIQMENRRDGAGVSWKWVQENSPIPYGEFTAFYKDLSAFITSKRDEYYALEVARQNIAASHNMLLDTFPNNLYNMLLDRKHINYEYGFLSDSTRNVFDTGNENPK